MQQTVEISSINDMSAKKYAQEIAGVGIPHGNLFDDVSLRVCISRAHDCAPM